MDECKGCANNKTEWCTICFSGDWYRTKEQKEYEDWMCDLMCGGIEDEEI